MPEGVPLISIKRDHCPDHVPILEGAKVYKEYGSHEGIEVSCITQLELTSRVGIRNMGFGLIER